jgi:hypothetical protein
VNKKMTARNRKAVIKKILRCLDVLAHDEFVSQYIGYDRDARRLSPFDSNNGVMGTAIELLDPICFYVDEQTGNRKQCLSFHWLPCISYDVEKTTFEKILENVSRWANGVLSKLEKRDFEVEISYDSASEDNWI